MDSSGTPTLQIRYGKCVLALEDITRPAIGFDEIWESYYWRLCRLNGFQFRENPRPLRVTIPNSGRSSTLGDFLAWAANSSSHVFTRNHTLWPLYRAVNQGGGVTPFRSETIRSILSIQGISREIRCCPECMRADIKATGHPIWHRTHQIPGTFWCYFHPDFLLEKISHPFSDNPLSISNSEAPSRRIVEHWKSNEIIRNFHHASELLLRRTKPFRRSQLEFSIYERAYGLGFSHRPSDSLPLLSSYISQMVPEAWISSLKIESEKAEICSRIESLLYWGAFCSERMVYPLLIATLWPHMDAALQDIESRDLSFTNRGFGTKANWLAMQALCAPP